MIVSPHLAVEGDHQVKRLKRGDVILFLRVAAAGLVQPAHTHTVRPLLQTASQRSLVIKQARACACVRVREPAPPVYRLLNKTAAAIRQCIYHPITATNPAPNT